MSFLLGRKSASAPASGAATPKNQNTDTIFDPVIDAKPHLEGHSGHLSASQIDALKVFKDQLVQANLYTPLSENSGSAEASYDEATLLRFLRARGFQPDAAVTQFQSAEDWRKAHDVENLYTSGFTIEEFEDAKRFYPRWTGRRDRQGLPLYVYRISALEVLQKDLEAIPASRRYQRIIGLYELMTHFSFRLCSHLPHPSSPTPISASVSIIDLGDASFASMFRLRTHFQEASKLATANYPETLGAIIVVNSPSFFPTIWSWIKGWFDEGTRNKIHVLGKDGRDTLLTLIDAENLPKMYGGDLDWSFADEPNLEDDVKALLPGGEMPKGPVVFNLKTGTVDKPGVPQ